MMIDSSVWLEILSRGPLAAQCEKQFKALKADEIVVSAMTFYEVYRNLKKKFGDESAMNLLGGLSGYQVIDVDRELALRAADLAHETGLAMADAMVLACAQQKGVPLLTLDNDFSKIEGVIVLRR
jgi:uncharacterized protein with PIN domain